MSKSLYLAHSIKSHYQLGQSTTEFVVVALVLVPLMLIVPLLGKYTDIAQTSIVASRYVAFEGAVHHSSNNNGGWKTDATLADEVRRRFFSKNDLSVKTNDVAGNFNADRNPLWFDYHGNSLLPDFDNNIGVKTQRITMNQPFGILGAFNLPQDNLYKGEVNVKIANVANLIPFDNINLTVNRRTVVLVDPWSANGSGQVNRKVKNAGLLFPYQSLSAPMLVLEPVISIFEPNSAPPEIGRVAPDIVPKDRVLQPY